VILRLAAKLDNIFVGNLCEPAPGDYRVAFALTIMESLSIMSMSSFCI